MLEQKITFDRFVRGIIVVSILCIVLILLDYLSNVLLPFFIAWLFAYMIFPIVSFFQYKLRVKSRVVSILLTLILIIGVITGAVMLLWPSAVEEYDKLKDLITEYFQKGSRNNSVPPSIEYFIQRNLNQQAITRFLQQGSVIDALKQTVPKLWSLIYETMNFVVGIFASIIILLYMFFILLDYEAVTEGWINLIPKKKRPFVVELMSDVKIGMNTYFRGQALVAAIVGTLYAIGFSIISFPMAIALGIFIGILGMVPYLHILGWIPTILLALLKAGDSGQNFWMIMLSALIVFATVQTIQETILTPKIMGKITGLNPAVILLSLSIWGALLGVTGVIIALPLTSLMLSYYRRYILHEEHATYAPKKEEKITEKPVDTEKNENYFENNQ